MAKETLSEYVKRVMDGAKGRLPGLRSNRDRTQDPKSIDTAIDPPFEAYKGREPYLFVSYAHKDSPFVFPDIKWLNDHGYRVWYDEGIVPGNDWPEDIANALDRCLVFLVFISPRAMESHNVRNEINFAISRRKPLIAIHIEPTRLSIGLELQMGHIQAILKYTLSEALYRRRIERVLDTTIIQIPLEEVRAKEECISKIMLLINHPAQQLVNMISAVPRVLVTVLDEITK